MSRARSIRSIATSSFSQIGPAGGFQVVDLGADTGCPRDLDQLLKALEETISFAAEVSGEEPPTGRGDSSERG